MLFPACTTGNTMLIGVDAHSTALPPVPLCPHPFVGCLMLWTSPKFPMSNVMINGSTACCVGAKSYSIHIPQGTWVDIPKVSFKVWYLTNLLTVGIVTVFGILANIQIAIVQGLIASLTKPTDAAAKETWSKICGLFSPFTSWQTWAQLLIPPLPLPGAEGNCAIGSPTVSINGGSMALGVPLGGASCSEIPIVPNASVLAFSHVQVGMTFAQLVEAFFNNAVQGAINYAGSKVASGVLDRYRCRLGLEPIDLVTGANLDDRVDFEIDGPLPMSWKRFYTSSLEKKGPIGWNWSHNYQRWLEFKGDTIVYHNEENRDIAFPAIETDGETEYLPFDRLRLTRVSKKTWQVQKMTGETMVFARLDKSDQAWIGRLENRAGSALVFRYDPKGNLHEIVHSTTQRIVIENDQAGRITRVALLTRSGSLQTLVAYSYDQSDDLAKVTDAAGKSFTYRYDTHHRMTRKTDRRGYSFHYAYDHNGRCIRSRGDDDLYMGEIEYIPPAKTTIMTAPSGGKFIYRYDDRNLVISIMDPYGGVQMFEYDGAGNLVAALDENGHATKYAYDDFGNVVEETNPLGGVTKRAYSPENLKLEETEPDGRTTQWEYDASGQVTAIAHPGGGRETREYDSLNRECRRITVDGAVQRFRYDSLNRLVAKLDDSGLAVEEYRYDDSGRRREVVVGGQVTRYTYDSAGRLTGIHYPDGKSEAFAFDAEGNQTEYTNRRGQRWRFEYSSWNKLDSVVDPSGARTRLTYTRADEPESVTDAGGHRTRYFHDQKDRVVKTERDGKPVRVMQYDRARNVTELRSDDGEILMRREFGPMKKPILRNHGQGTAVSFEYDVAARLTKASGQDISITREYGDLGELVSEAVGGEVLRFETDERRRRTRIDYGQGLEATIEYHDENSSMIVTDPAGGEHTLYRRRSTVQTHLWPNKLRECLFYLKAGVEEHHHLTNFDASPPVRLIERETVYGDDWTPIRRRDHKRNAAYDYEYDICGRLVRVSRDGRIQEEFRVDPAGNVAQSDNGKCIFGDCNQLVRTESQEFQYDRSGCLSRRNGNDGEWAYEHDALGRLRSMTGPDGVHTEFEYDPLDRLYAAATEAGRYRFQWHDHRLIRETLPNGVKRVYMWVLDDDPAPWMFVELREDASHQVALTPYYLHCDRLGVVREISDKDGSVVWAADYSAYGMATLSPESRIEFNLRLPGQYWIQSSSLSYNGRRFYDPRIARFIEPDPIGLRGGCNLYAYPANPLAETDVTGQNNDCSESRPPSDDDFDEAPTQVFRRPPNPELAEACGPAQMPWMVRPGEGTRPASARDARPGSPMVLDPSESHRYMYVVREDGTVTYAPQVMDGNRETVKHTDLAEGGPARVSGEINYDPATGVWLMDDNSGRYSAQRDQNGNVFPNRDVRNTEAARDLIYESGTDPNQTTIVPVPGIGGR